MSVVLVTGASSGIGRLAALEFARRGDTVHATMRDLANAASLRDEAAAAGLAVEVGRLDVTDPASITAAVDEVVARSGRIDVLVNNAGVASYGPVEAYDDDEVDEVFATNFHGPLRMMRAVLPAMRHQGGGAIVNVSSMSGRWPEPFIGVYSASKHALVAVSRSMHYELHPFGIRVAVIEPGNVATGIARKMKVARRFRDGSVAPAYAELASRLHAAQERLVERHGLCDPADVARLIADVSAEQWPRLRHLIGEDAVAMDELSDDEVDQQTRSRLGLQAAV